MVTDPGESGLWIGENGQSQDVKSSLASPASCQLTVDSTLWGTHAFRFPSSSSIHQTTMFLGTFM